MPRIVGIDLGTTNSLVAVVEQGRPVVLPDANGARLIPSVVSFKTDGRPVVGAEARRVGFQDPARMVYSIKRLMGKGKADIPEALPFDFSGSTAQAVRVTIAGKRYTPVELSSLVLRKLKAIAEASLFEPVKQVVLTVPAHFNDAQRQATILAGRLAGLEVVRLVNEPTAACLAYGLDRSEGGTVVVYDMGGGTFDVSVLTLKEGLFQVLATGGDTELGGDDFDRALFAHVAEVIRRDRKLDPEAMPETHDLLRRAVQAARHELSQAPAAMVHLDHPALGETFSHPVSRVEFESLIAPYVERTLAICRRVLADAGLSPDEVQDVALVGGATRTPMVRAAVAGYFGRTPDDSLDPDEVVALGAALQADVLANAREDVLLLDVCPLSLGIETASGAVSRLIERNSPVPTSAREIYTTYADYQTTVMVHVLQGEREQAKDCRSLARFEIPIEPAPAGLARLEIKFTLDANGVLNVRARDLRRNTEQAVEVKATFGLSDAEIEQMLQEAIAHAGEDRLAGELLAARQEADVLSAATQKALHHSVAMALAPEEREAIEAALAQLKSAHAGADPYVIHAAVESLDAATRHLAELVMTSALQAVTSPHAPHGGESS